MSNLKKRVLIVDDNKDDIHVLMENLKQEYAVLAATSGEKALALAAKQAEPDVILMDVSMPGMNGYETCRQLKSNPETNGINVIFISAHDTTEEKLAGYEVGGDDYLIKPVQPKELQQKVRLAIHNKTVRHEMAAEKKLAMQTAMSAISSTGEQGVVVDFMRRSFSVKSIPELARLVVSATNNFGLENSVQIRGQHKQVTAGTSEPVPPLEQEILTRMKDIGRLKEKGGYFVANFGNITQLIKNMPEDEDTRGRLRDHLAMLLEGAEARLKMLEINNKLEQAVKDTNEVLAKIQVREKQQKQRAMEIMDDVMRDLEKSFLSYGLLEEQENLLLKVVQDGVEKSLDNFEAGLKLDELLQAIINRLTDISKV